MNGTEISHLNKPKPIPWYNNRILHIVVLLFISSFILFPKIKNTPLHDFDEARYATSALETVNSGNWITMTYNHLPDLGNLKFPLGTWLIAINYKLFGVNEVSVRLWSVIFTILTTILVYLLGSLIKNRWLGILAALIFITSIQVVNGHAGITGDFDAGASFFLTLSLFLFLLFYKTRKNSFLFFSMVTVGLGTMYKSFIPGFIPLVIIFIFLLFSKEKKYFFNPKIIFFCTAIIIAIISPWLIARSISDNSFILKLLGGDYWQRFTSSLTNGPPGSFWFYPIQLKDSFYPWIYFLPFGLFLVFKDYIKNKNKDYSFLLIWIFTVFLIFSVATTKNFWYILPIFPAMAIVVALFWSTLLKVFLELKWGKILSVALIALLIINIVSAILNADYYFDIHKNYNNFSSFINQESVKKELLSSDIIVNNLVVSQSNLFYLERLLNDKFTVSSIISCNLQDNQRWLVGSDANFLRLYLKSCPGRKIISRYVTIIDSDIAYSLIR